MDRCKVPEGRVSLNHENRARTSDVLVRSHKMGSVERRRFDYQLRNVWELVLFQGSHQLGLLLLTQRLQLL